MEHVEMNQRLIRYAMVLVVIVGLVVFAGLCYVSVNMQKPRVSRQPTCSDYASYDEILAAYHAGNYALDGNDNDGIPCENRR